MKSHCQSENFSSGNTEKARASAINSASSSGDTGMSMRDVHFPPASLIARREWFWVLVITLVAGCSSSTDDADKVARRIDAVESEMRGIQFDRLHRAMDNRELLADTPAEVRDEIAKQLDDAERVLRQEETAYLKLLNADLDRLRTKKSQVNALPINE